MRNRRGMTLIEMLVAMVVFSVVLGSALSAFRSQSRGFAKGADRMTVLQNVRFALASLEADVRTAGSGVPDLQPFLVLVDEDVFAFNSNYTTNVANDIFAVYYDPDAPTGTVAALTQTQTITIPNSSFSYPDTTYAASAAETLTFFFVADTSTTRGDDYMLLRQVNDAPPELVSRNLLRTGTLPFFEYHRELVLAGGARIIQPVPAANLPLSHHEPIHGAPGDTALVTPTTGIAPIDQVRGVRINLTATNGATGTDEQLRTLSRLVRIPNAGIASRKTCGDAPLPLAALVAVGGTDVNGDPIVTLQWNQAIDESGGEKDVVRYVIWRRDAAAPDWGDPYLSIPTGNPSYVYTDAAVQSGDQFFYQVAAQDCTPSLSGMAIAGPVVVP